MAEKSGISWTDHSWAPWHGCTKVSVGEKGACANCYAEHLDDTRFHRVKFGNHPRVLSAESTWKQPFAWNRRAMRAGTRPFVFCSHLSDIFDNQVDPAWRKRAFDVMRATPHLIYLVLTKRPQNIEKMVAEAGGLPPNVALGCTVVTQAEADRDLPHLLKAAAALQPPFVFASIEPMMEAMDIQWALSPNPLELGAGFLRRGMFSPGLETLRRLDWVITGGETKQGKAEARPSDPAWFRSIRDQCEAARVYFHHKQNGEWTTYDQHVINVGFGAPVPETFTTFPNMPGREFIRVGKIAAGRKLDGIEYDDRPHVEPLKEAA